MNNTRTNPSGIDLVIDKVQRELYDLLTTKYDGKSIKGFSRAYKNPREKGFVPEVFVSGSNGEYADVYFDDSVDLMFLFLEKDDHSTKDETVFSTEVKIVFMMDLQRLLQDNPEENPQDRADENVREDIVPLLELISDNGFDIIGVEKGIRNVFRGYDTESIQFQDMQPNHIFAVKTTMYYYVTQKCS